MNTGRINQHLPDPFLAGIQYRHRDTGFEVWAVPMSTTFAVEVDVGVLSAPSGDYLCKDVHGTLWPTARATFLAHYEPVAAPVKDTPVVLPPAAARSEVEGLVLPKPTEP